MPKEPNDLSELSVSEGEDLARLFAISIDPEQQTHLDVLQSILNDHPLLYWFLRSHFWISIIGTNGFYITFPITSSDAGIQTLVQFFNSTTIVSTDVGYGIGVPLSLIETLSYMLTASPKREALLSFFNFLSISPRDAWCQNPILARLERQVTQSTLQWMQKFMNAPSETLLNTAVNSAHHVILLMYNLTWIAAALVFLSPLRARQLAVIILFYGNEYCRKYINRDYYQGVAFWREGGLSTFRQLFQDEPLMAIQITLQCMCTIGLRAFPIFYFLAIATRDVLGFWPPPLLMSGIAVFAGTHIYTLSSYLHYTEPKRQALELMANHAQPPTLALHQFRAQWLQSSGFLDFVKQEPIPSLVILCRIMIGGYFGYGISRFVANDVLAPYLMVFLMPVCASVLGFMLYQVEKERHITHSYLQFLQLGNATTTFKPSQTINIIATTINILGSFVGTLSNMGLLLLLFDNNQSVLKAFILLLSIESMILNILFNKEKCIVATQSIGHTFSHYCGAFFKSSPHPQNTLPAPNLEL
ncbi:MAG: hypothetical protein NTW08_06295 [Gammaproteobacteria bacterium]|nr:hypothetical protein [Gammaproteobacteria bacterium]